MKYLFLSAFMGLITISSFAQTNASAVLSLNKPADQASVIKKYENIVFEVSDVDRASLKVHQQLTVLNEHGKHALYFQEFIDKYQSIDDVVINVYDANGENTGKYKKKDLQSYAIGDGLIDDGYMLVFRVPVTRYPVTVEYKFEKRMKGTMFYPSYDILFPGERIQSSTFTARIAKPLDLRFRERNTTIKPVITEEDKFKIYTWKVNDLPAIEYEEGSLNDASKYPGIILAPTKFKYDNYNGDFSSWQSFGSFFFQLNKGRDELPEHRVQFFRDMVKNSGSDREKARILYQYLQENFRYVSIQLGIGGFQTFTAESTDQNKYGDCKALSNYMKAMLKAVGINSYLAVINAGENRSSMEEDFPRQMANHMILCVPQKKDTIWLECTSRINDFDVLGTFTENRKAVLLTENGGVLVSTPKSKAIDNQLTRHTRIKLNDDGSGSIEQLIDPMGSYRMLVENMKDEKPEDLKEFVVLNWGLKHPDEFSIDLGEKRKKQQPVIKATYEKLPEFIAGSKMFLAPRIYSFWSKKLPDAKDRKMDYYFYQPAIFTDTTEWMLPEGFIADALPAKKEMDCEYANFSYDYYFNPEQRTMITTARLAIKNHHIPVKEYANVKAFFDKVIAENNQRVVIKKQ